MQSEAEFDALINLIYEAALDSSLWAQVMERMADFLGSTQAQLAMVDLTQPENAIVQVTRFDPGTEAEYLRRRDKEDTWWQRLQIVRTGQIFTGSELIDTESFLKAPLTQEVRKTTDIAFMLGGWYQKSGNILGFLSVLRGLSKDDFRGDERATLTRILPHIRRAMSIHRRFGAMTRHATRLEAGLNASLNAIFVTNSDGRVTLSNTEADSLLKRCCGVSLTAGLLTLEDREAQSKMERTLRQPLSDFAAGNIMARRTATAEPLVVQVFPIADAGSGMVAVGGAHCSAIVITEMGQAAAPTMEILKAFYGLTPAEAKIAQAVVAGKRLKEIAETENRSIHTIRTQLKYCFVKLGVRSQAGLVKRLRAERH